MGREKLLSPAVEKSYWQPGNLVDDDELIKVRVTQWGGLNSSGGRVGAPWLFFHLWDGVEKSQRQERDALALAHQV